MCGVQFAKKTLARFTKLFRTRDAGSRQWTISLGLVLCLFQFLSVGSGNLWFLFWKVQYRVTMDQYADMAMVGAVRECCTNWLLVPLLTKRFRDTTLIIIASIITAAGCLVHSFGRTIPFLYFSLIFFLFWSFGSTATRSAISKLVSPGEVGTAFTFLGILCKLVDFFSKPFFGFLYKLTVLHLPAAWLYVLAAGFATIAILVVFIHFGIQKLDNTIVNRDGN